MAIINLSAPWVQFYHEVDAFFKNDSEVTVVYDEAEIELRLYVSNKAKADALRRLITAEKTWENITLKIVVIPGNVIGLKNATLIDAALEGNDALSYIRTVRGIFSNDINYVVFRNEVVQYFTDDLSDDHGLRSTLYQDIAKEIFCPIEGVYYCTDLP